MKFIEQNTSLIHSLKFQLSPSEVIYVNYPEYMISFLGAPYNRDDKWIQVPQRNGRRKKQLQSKLTGPAEVCLSVPHSHSLHLLETEEWKNLRIDARHLFAYSDGIHPMYFTEQYSTTILDEPIPKLKCNGSGFVTLIAYGTLLQQTITKEQTLYIDAGCLVAYPETAQIELQRYGNEHAAYHMNYHWKITGEGTVWFQTKSNATTDSYFLTKQKFSERILHFLFPQRKRNKHIK